jgi:hypothetical protein
VHSEGAGGAGQLEDGDADGEALTDSPRAMDLATRWMERLEQDTAGGRSF